MLAAPVIERIAGRAFRFPTDAPEADGTLAWDHTTAVIAEASAGGVSGVGYTYAAPEAADLINTTLAEVVVGQDAFAIPSAWEAMVRRVRNLGWRVGVRAVLFPAHAASRGGRRAAGRRHALRRDHRLPARGGHRGCAHGPALRPHRACAPPSCLLCGTAAAARGVVSRSRADRADVVRGRAGAQRRTDPSGFVAARSRPRAQTCRCRAIRGVMQSAFLEMWNGPHNRGEPQQ